MDSLDLEEMTNRIMQELQQRLGTASQSKGTTRSDIKDEFQPQEQLPSAVAESNESFTPLRHNRRNNIPQPRSAEMLEELQAATPARIGVWRAGTRPLTREMLLFRCDHAGAVDTVYGEVSDKLIEKFQLFQVETLYENTENYLKRPDMGRLLTEESINRLRAGCQKRAQVQIVVSDGLSANAIEHNLSDVYPALMDSLNAYGLKAGTPIFIKGGRVAVMDHIGEILEPDVLVMLIGERPGLVSSSSMSAYMCYRPRKGMVESARTVLSNIHQGGTPPVEGGAHIGTIVSKMLEQKTSGVKLVI
ncbi:ethanolamine ammonia-lyase subunit EutC [Paenibacillus pasadenensis]|uniref:ethanolamine ammonia-lyase subunit EutC n=1 Tax=Paenibacillus pasadenensis TaxID=217090 RepID=UPI002559553E|nr:ethanolamine ammonia-lyase subunit EutC [Paenibacillus pasadenensis]